jgi:hypothetical protein
MKNYILETGAGDQFDKVALKAKETANKLTVKTLRIVQFEFNGRTVLVSKDTNLDHLWRDYSNSWTMDWREIGPNCVAEYAPSVQKELDGRQKIQQEKQDAQQKEWDLQEAKERAATEQKTAGIVFEVVPGLETEYAQYVEKNSADGYSKAVIEYGETWAKLMQIEIANGKEVKDIGDETQKGLGYLGITGFQYGCAVNGLSHFWKHGESLRIWHNKGYGHEGKGVVNPAVLTIGTK